MNTARSYFEDVAAGRVTACVKLQRLSEILVERYSRGEYRGWHFDQSRADRPCEFIERFCMLPSGKLGKRFVLEPYEAAVIQTAFGWVDDDGLRQLMEILWLMGRKNGKTSIMAALELYMLLADHEGAPQVYTVATGKEQASLCYGAALKMVRQSPKLSKQLHKGTIPDRDADGLMCDRNLGYLTPLSSATRRLDGLDVHFGGVDELSAVTDRDLYDLLKQGTSSRSQPMLFTITTQGWLRNGIFDDQYAYATRWLDDPTIDDRFMPFIYELDARDEWTDESKWIKANPGYGTVKKKETLRAYVQKARNDPRFLPTVLCKDFNLPENQAQAWLSFDEAVNEEELDTDGLKYAVVGFDASDTTDLTAARALMFKPMRDADGNVVRDSTDNLPMTDGRIYEMGMYWMPETTILERSDKGMRTGRDDVPYDAWVARGLMRTVPGNQVPKSVLLDWIRELRDAGIYVYAVGYDPWHMDDSTTSKLELLVGKDRVRKIRQGPKTLSDPMKRFKAELRAGNVVDGHNPVNEWCRLNTEVKVDVNDNMQPVKKLSNPKNRIDGMMAELDAYVVMLDIMDDLRRLLK